MRKSKILIDFPVKSHYRMGWEVETGIILG